MTIYDADFLSGEGQYTGVKDSVAGNPMIVQEEPNALEPVQDQVVDSNEMIDAVSEKEFNFRALRDSIAQEKAERESERQRYQQELEIMRSQIQNSQIPVKKGILDDLADDDLITVEKIRQVQQEQRQEHQEEIRNLRYENLENRARLSHSDYNEVMDKYSIPLLRNDRGFAKAFQESENPAEFAYNIGIRERALQAMERPPPEPQINHYGERIVENARKPGTLSSARGGQPTLSQADYISKMNDAEFAAYVKKNLAEV